MDIEKIIEECMARKKVTPALTTKQLVDSVMDEMAAYKLELAKRPEFLKS